MATLMTSTRRSGLIVLAALAVALSACSPAAGPSDTSGAGSGDTAVGSGQALAFSGTTLDGSSLDAATLAGSPVVLWFWAPWCAICRAEAPDIATVAAEFDGQVRLLGIPGRGAVDAMQAFVSETGTDAITHVVDADGSLWTRFGVISQPSFVFVDSAGGARTFSGSLGADDLRSALEDLV